MKDYSVYLFDFDGTIVDSFESMVYIFLTALEKFGLKADESEVLQFSRQPISKTFFDKGGKKEDMRDFFDVTIGLLNEEINLYKNKLFDDTLPCINALKAKGHKVGIVTSNSNEHVKDILVHLNVDPNIFDVIVGFEATDAHKPEAGPVLKGLELLGIEPNVNNVVYVGDSLDDVLCAKNAKVDPLLIERHNEYSDYKENKIESLMELIND